MHYVDAHTALILQSFRRDQSENICLKGIEEIMVDKWETRALNSFQDLGGGGGGGGGLKILVQPIRE